LNPLHVIMRTTKTWLKRHNVRVTLRFIIHIFWFKI
jgi:hypothetical protein